MKIFSLVLMLALTWSLPIERSNATTCYVKPDTDDACFTYRDQNESGKGRRLSGYLENCESKKIVSRCYGASICYETKNKTQCEICDKGPCLSQLDTEPSLLSFAKILEIIYTQSPTQKYGGKRLRNEEILSGFPKGEIALPKEALQFPLAKRHQVKIDHFELTAKNQSKAILQTDQIQGSVSISSAHLKPGELYEWKATVDGKKYRGKFKTLSQSDQETFTEELEALFQDSSDDPYNRAIQEAALADYWGLAFNKQQAIERARQYLQEKKP